MAIRDADEPVRCCSHQGAHEQLPSHRIGTPNQHHLRMESREMGLRVLCTSEGDENQIKEAFINGGRGHPPSHLKFFLLVFSKLKEDIK